MGNRKKAEQLALREKVAEAVQKGIIDPRDVYCYVLDNGWQFGNISMTTIEKHLKDNGVVYVQGRWEKPE